MKIESELYEKIMKLKDLGYEVELIAPAHIMVSRGGDNLGRIYNYSNRMELALDFKKERSDKSYFPKRKRFMDDLDVLGIPHIADGSKESFEQMMAEIESTFDRLKNEHIQH